MATKGKVWSSLQTLICPALTPTPLEWLCVLLLSFDYLVKYTKDKSKKKKKKKTKPLNEKDTEEPPKEWRAENINPKTIVGHQSLNLQRLPKRMPVLLWRSSS